ncbi:uncharacterized protein LOC121378256 [Gigantopelta aegis]|uniref:uncharacterized protein LOC121378256 n=1 Tax=Gigantopelta aegis TaxID=1735272 RepID=UPI001B888A5E|nr:uncharacterized protein LOC121378256 [Gigantopelta aegis]
MMLFTVALWSLLVVCTAAPSKSLGHPRTRRQIWSDCVVNGVTYRHGEYFTLTNTPCLRYRCNQGGYRVEIWQCEHENKCHALNSEIRLGCDIHRCENRGDWVGFVSARHECRDERGQCHPINSQRRVGCSEQRCEQRGNMIGFFSVNQGPQMCQDANGACHSPGPATFPYRFHDGRYYNSCRCVTMGSHLSVRCVDTWPGK